MKPHVILLLTTDPAVESMARDAVLAMRHGLRVRHTTPEAFRELCEGWTDVDVVVLDLDPGVHGTALLAAIGDRFPVLVLTSLEKDYMLPLAKRHGAVGCLAKPFNSAQLQEAIEAVLIETPLEA
jgi:DNA-binding response OmpR family regulator